MRTFDITLTKDGQPVVLRMRLTMESRKKLKALYKEKNLETIFEAMDDIDKMTTIITEALNYKGNTNEVKTGEEFIDLMVDNYKGGMEETWDVISGIAYESGLISKKMKEAIDKQANDAFDIDFEEFGEEGNRKAPQVSTT